VPVDLTADWNGRPHLLLRRPGENKAADRFEVLALGDAPENPKQSNEQLTEIQRFFDDPARKGAGKLTDLLKSPERRIRISAQLAITRHTEALALIMHAAGSDDPRTSLHALWAAGILARRGAAAVLPGDDTDFAPLPNEKLARNAAQIVARGLDSPKPRFRIQTLRTLAAGRRSAGLVQFPKFLADPNPEIRDEALLAAARMRWRALVTSLSSMRSAKSPPPLDPDRIADVLDHTYSPPQLRIFARARNPLLRLAAVESLRRANHPALEAFVADPDPLVAGAVVRAAARSGPPGLRPAVAEFWHGKSTPDSWDAETRRALEDCSRPEKPH